MRDILLSKWISLVHTYINYFILFIIKICIKYFNIFLLKDNFFFIIYIEIDKEMLMPYSNPEQKKIYAMGSTS